ncbi:precorrin-2 C(20)-methyltransferase [Streptomyces sp. DH37]|uniref:precorrin-2 C(20)-methyltransferase n=1 Tax=Streptomyces sp. DH37 TaxID=3040122 RepID=UPI0024435767|nr:precorrin-2 C(20)-methyltransferase [Streptomyces sp. DH37]MDG9703642.1 precorrin-2 C(20)-methyltransferase [Streptomyces sp. DH37]
MSGNGGEPREADGPRLIGVGVGPGDPDLVTVKGVKALRSASAVVVPVMEDSGTGRAEATVLHYVSRERIVRVVFALNERSDRARREAAWDAAGERVAALLRTHGTVAFATIGDPNVYSTFTYLAQTVGDLVPEAAVETVPGITAMQDLAARCGAVLTEGTEPLTLVPVTAGDAVLRQALEGPGTVVAYKFGRRAREVAAALRATGRTEGAVWGSALGLPQESIRPAADLEAELASGDAALPYLSTLIAPARREGRGGKL